MTNKVQNEKGDAVNALLQNVARVIVLSGRVPGGVFHGGNQAARDLSVAFVGLRSRLLRALGETPAPVDPKTAQESYDAYRQEKLVYELAGVQPPEFIVERMQKHAQEVAQTRDASKQGV